MSFNDLATQIVKKSVRSAICIDDEFAEPYEETNEKVRADIPRKLYQSFKTEGNCTLDFYRYKPEDNWVEKSKIVLSNKDLVILDWELDIETPKYKNTLSILESIINHGANQFLIIYTHSDDLEDIVLNIEAFYSKINIITQEKKVIQLAEYYEESGEDFEELETYIKRIVTKNIIFNHKADFKSILNKFGIIGKEFGQFIAKSKKYLGLSSEKDVLEFILLNIYRLNEFTNTIERKVQRVISEHVLLNINNTIVLISKKSEDGEENGKILPEHLFDSFTDAIVKKPSNAMALMACELKDVFRSNLAFIGIGIPQIDEKAFYFHWKNLRNEEDIEFKMADDQFRYFLLQTWLNEISQFTIKTSADISFFNALTFYGEEQKMFDPNADEPIEELIKLGAHYSTLNVEISQRADKKIQFGDIFWKQDSSTTMNEVLLSITPHCDSIRPDKINDLLHFIRGHVITLEEEKKVALQKSETEHFSFLNINGIAFCIKWHTKPFSIFIKKDNNDVSKLIEIKLKEVDFKLKHIAILKENYTQRIANQSFSHAMRVGITLPSIKN